MTKEELIFKKERIKKQIENEQKSIEEINKLIKELENKKWKPACLEKYYYIDNVGDVYSTYNDNVNIDKMRFSLGNYFKTREEAEFEVERLKVLEELKEFSYEFSDDEWKNKAITKYLLSYDFLNNNIVIDYWYTVKYNNLYFKTKEDVKKAIKKLAKID